MSIIEDVTKKSLSTDTFLDPFGHIDPGREGRAAAKEQAKAVNRQKQKEQAKLADTSDVLARKKLAGGGSKGRSLLTATGSRGITKTLGG